MKKKKMTQLEYFTHSLECTVSSITSMIESLKSTNQSIDLERQKNVETMANIQKENECFDELQAKNERIISNFSNLLQ